VKESESDRVRNFKAGILTLDTSLVRDDSRPEELIPTKLRRPDNLRRGLTLLIKRYLVSESDGRDFREILTEWLTDFPPNYAEAVELICDVRDELLPPLPPEEAQDIGFPVLEEMFQRGHLRKDGPFYYPMKSLGDLARRMNRGELYRDTVTMFIRKKDGSAYGEDEIARCITINWKEGKVPAS